MWGARQKAEPAAGQRPSGPAPDWAKLLPAAIGQMRPHERELLLRIAEARGRRVPIGELADAFGIPAAPSLEHDLPGLFGFVKSRQAAGQSIEMPVVACGTGDKGWYWMAPELGHAFRQELGD
ncbi:MAG: hypothetical protein R2725_12625 [Solirubrobacterales bacterium]